MTTMEFWFDPACPFTWATSRWARELASDGLVNVRWKVMSLAILNEGSEIPEQYREGMARSWQPIRVLVAADERAGSDAVGQLYEALGRRVHDEARQVDAALVGEALAEVGLPADLVDAMDDAGLDEAVRRSHTEGQERVGTDAGSPLTAYHGGPAYFGPVVAPTPTGEDARYLLEAMVALSKVPSFSELKRSRGPL
jgi:2-hydroxychromene-2-carboxylate isomerase